MMINLFISAGHVVHHLTYLERPQQYKNSLFQLLYIFQSTEYMGPALKLFSPFPTHTSPCEREELRKGAVEKKAS
jgi:hypothetical protein